MSLLQMSLSGALMAAAAALIRAVGLYRLPKRFFVVLWKLVLVRLLVPFALPSAYSVYSLWARWTAAKPAGGTPRTEWIAHTVPMENAATGSALSPTSPAAAMTPWTAIWLAGALVCAVYFVWAYARCRREFQESLPSENAFALHWLAQHSICRSVMLRRSDRVSAPLTYGILRPVILLPDAMENAGESSLRYVLAHELTHIRRWDAAVKLLFTAAVCLHWFNPMVWGAYLLANRDIELSCDEAVLREQGADARAAYARTLIHLEEHKGGFVPIGNNFSKNAIEERIVAIMKMKKTSVLAVCVAAALLAGATAAFATSAETPSAGQRGGTTNAGTLEEQQTILSYTDPVSGLIHYSMDGGKTYETMTQQEWEQRYSAPDVEWWTYEEYQAWLETEKKALQDMLGERGWTGGRGEFVWTQEMIDETIALYEKLGEQIRQGYLISKTVAGSEDTMLASGEAMLGIRPTDRLSFTEKEIAELPSYEEYAPFGIVQTGDALYYQNEKVRYFEDSADMGEGGISSRCQYYCADGTVSLRTVRQSIQNSDGSTDPFGPILRVETITPEEAERKIEEYCSLSPYAAATADEVEENLENTLKPYAPFGLTYENLTTERFAMYWHGKQVHSLYDPVTGIWAANNLHGSELGSDAVDLEAVYENGKLTGLRESAEQHRIQTTAVSEGNETDEGTPLPDMFDKYAPYGITYQQTETPYGMERCLYWNGQYVNSFVDRTPAGGVFSFGSTVQKEDGLKVYTVYDKDGVLTGVRT